MLSGPSQIQNSIIEHLLVNESGTAYGIAKALSLPWKTVAANIEQLISMGVIIKNGKHCMLNPYFTDDKIKQRVVVALNDMYDYLDRSGLTAKGILYFIQYIITHTELIEEGCNGRRRKD